jgi:uncharacterized protein YceK
MYIALVDLSCCGSVISGTDADDGMFFLLSDVGYKHRAPNGAHSRHNALAILSLPASMIEKGFPH